MEKNTIKPTEKDSSTIQWIRNGINQIQQTIGDYLNQKTAGWPAGRKKMALILFCIVTGNISLYIAGKAILSGNGPPVVSPVERAHLPKIGSPLHRDTVVPDFENGKYYEQFKNGKNGKRDKK